MDPPKYVAYPRELRPATYGSVERMESIGKGYYGLRTVALLSALVYLLSVAYVASQQYTALMAVLVFTLIQFYFTLPLAFVICRRIGKGMEWRPSKTVTISFLLALNSFFFAGYIGYFFLERMVRSEVMKYGVRIQPWKLLRADFQAGLAKRRQGGDDPAFFAEPPGTG